MIDLCAKVLWSGGFRHRCSRSAKAPGAFCGIHSPDAVASRREKSRERDREHLARATKAANKALADRRALTEELPRLRALLEECNAVCLCGCPPEEHESLGEDGEACGNDRHECIRVAPAVLGHVKNLRRMVVFLAGAAACDANGSTDPVYWIQAAKDAAAASKAKSDAEVRG